MNNIIERKWKQGGMVSIEDLRGTAFQAEELAHTFRIRGVNESGAEMALSGSVGAVFLRADNTDVAITGTVTDGAAVITLPEECYEMPGRFGLTVYLTSGGQTVAIYAAIGSVSRTSSGNVSTGSADNVADLINAINEAIASIPQNYQALESDVSFLKSAVDKDERAIYNLGDVSASWASGGLNPNTGKNSTNDKRIRNSSYIPVNPGRVLKIACTGIFMFKIFYYSAASNDAYLRCDAQWTTGSQLIENDGNAAYYIKLIGGYTDDRTIEDVTAASGQIEIYRAVTTFRKDKGLLSDLGYTALTSCTEPGFYRTGSAYTESITDMPDDFETEAFELSVMNPAFASEDFCIQTIETVSGKQWSRVIRYTSGAWSVYRGWIRNLNAQNGVTLAEFESLRDELYKNDPVSIVNESKYYWNIEAGIGGTAVKTYLDGYYYASAPISVTPGEVYTITAEQGSTHKARIWTVTDDEYEIISMAQDYNDTALHTETFTVPEGGTKLILTKFSTSSQTLYKKRFITDILDSIKEPLKGKKLSLLGDSISAYAGTIPEGNDAYYNGSRAGVTSPDQMWWKILCDKTGMEPLIINGWSGSGVNWQTDSDHTSKVPMSDDSRCRALDDGTDGPDVVIIAGGVNDYSYAEAAQNEPLSWDGRTVPGYTEPTSGKKVYNSFTEAYAAMVMKIRDEYPDAIIVALSTWFTMRGTDTGVTYTHTVGSNSYTQQDYNDKIRFVAEQMHIPFIDVSNIGFNRSNFYPTYAQDSSATPTHPNANGQHVMGSAIAEKLVALVKGYLN